MEGHGCWVDSDVGAYSSLPHEFSNDISLPACVLEAPWLREASEAYPATSLTYPRSSRISQRFRLVPASICFEYSSHDFAAF